MLLYTPRALLGGAMAHNKQLGLSILPMFAWWLALRFARRVACLFYVAGTFLLMSAHTTGYTQTIQIIDDRGKHIHLSAVPKRIVSTLPSLTETVCILGQCHKIVGVDIYSNWPHSVLNIAKVGEGISPNLESIAALRPDVVLMASSSRGIKQLEQLGITVVALEPKTYADLYRTFTVIAQLLGQPQPKPLWDSLQDKVKKLRHTLPPRQTALKIYLEVDPGPYGASESSFIGETLTLLGLGNILSAKLGPFPKINPEFVVRSQPDLIVVGQSSEQPLRQRPGWSALKAIHNNHMCVLTQPQMDTLVRAGPRIADAAQLIADCIRAHDTPNPP